MHVRCGRWGVWGCDSNVVYMYVREGGAHWSTQRKPPDNQSKNCNHIYIRGEFQHSEILTLVICSLGWNVPALNHWTILAATTSETVLVVLFIYYVSIMYVCVRVHVHVCVCVSVCVCIPKVAFYLAKYFFCSVFWYNLLLSFSLSSEIGQKIVYDVFFYLKCGSRILWGCTPELERATSTRKY